MCKRKVLGLNRGGFSCKGLLGITKAKTKISRATGIPLMRSGRQRKFGAKMDVLLL
jgi:hypothetical protein